MPPRVGGEPLRGPTPRGLSGHHREARRKRAGETLLQVGQDWAGALGERGVEISRRCWRRRSNSELRKEQNMDRSSALQERRLEDGD